MPEARKVGGVPEARKVGGVPEARKVGGVPEARKMTETTLGLFSIFVLSVFIGFEVISKVSPILHTPLMSGANAIHGVILVGAILVVGLSDGAVETVLGFLAIVLATINVVGGFVVTDRMLEMFKGRRRPPRSDVEPPSGGAG